MIPKLDWREDTADSMVNFCRYPAHKPALESGKAYALRHKTLDLFYSCSPLNDRESHFTQNIDEARRWSAEYLNRTAWDWTLECEAVCLT